MNKPTPTEETVNQLARETDLGRLYTTGTNEEGAPRWVLTVPSGKVFDPEDHGAEWMTAYLYEVARAFGRHDHASRDSKALASFVMLDFADVYDDAKHQAANDVRKPLTRERAGV